MGQEFAAANAAAVPLSSPSLDAAALLLQGERKQPAGPYGAQRKPFQEPARDRRRLIQIKRLSRLTTICAWCKRIRNRKGFWQRSQGRRACAAVKLSHGICPECADRTYNAYREEKVGRNTVAPLMFNYSNPGIPSGGYAIVAG